MLTMNNFLHCNNDFCLKVNEGNEITKTYDNLFF